MRTALAASLLATAWAAAPYTNLVTFDGKAGTTFTWQETNDPVMGGLSTGNFSVSSATNTAIFQGDVQIVPSLKAPGFCQSLTQDVFAVKFNDLSAYTHLQLLVRSFIPYAGFKVSFAADTLDPVFQSFKSDYNVTGDGQWQTVTIPFNQFSNNWSPATGEPIKRCSEDPSVCPTPKNLQDISQVGLWAEGVAGPFKLEVQWIRGVNAGSEQATAPQGCPGPVESTLLYNVSGRLAADYLPPGFATPTESLPQAVCCDANEPYPEPELFFSRPDIALFSTISATGVTTFYDSVCGLPVFTAPVNRTFAEWQAESTKFGWPSFRAEEVVSQNIVVMPDGKVRSACGTGLGSFDVDTVGPRYCIDLVCISGVKASSRV